MFQFPLMQLIQLPDWPTWALYPFYGLMVILTVGMATLKSSADGNATGELSKKELVLRSDFEAFKRGYFVLYVVLMLSDWVQGTNMYTLYQGYGVDINTLFITGFLTSGFFSIWIGPYIDRYGRKKACILYCIGEVVINVLEHSPDFATLMVGRVIGGLTTALLFTAFESWMVSSHREHGFKEEWLAETYSVCSVGNGLIAVASGIISQADLTLTLTLTLAPTLFLTSSIAHCISNTRLTLHIPTLTLTATPDLDHLNL